MTHAPLRDALFWDALAERLHQPLSRRDFAHLLAASAALAGVGCSVGPPPGEALPYGHSAAQNRPGVPTAYATSLWRGAYGVGVLAMTREGRTIKIEGNPRHPASLGATGPWEQASVLQLYDPNRLKTVSRRGAPASWEQALTALRQRLGHDGDGVALVWEPRCSPYVTAQLEALRQRFPKVRVFAHTPLANHNAVTGARLAFGADREPLWNLNRAALVVSFDADFLSSAPDSLRLARQWADARAGHQAQTFCAESAVTLTGLNAHMRLPARPDRAACLAAALLTTLLGTDSTTNSHGLELSADEAAFLTAVRQRWRSDTSVFLPGPAMPPEIHAAAAAINGACCAWRAPLAAVPAETLTALHDALMASAVHTTWFLGGNPLYTAPGDVPLHDALARAAHRFYLGLHPNETADACDWVLPEAHPLETWGDAQAYDGTVSFQQPTLSPLYAGRTWGDVLATLVDDTAPQGRAALMAHWRAQKHTDEALHAALAQGMLSNTAAPILTPSVSPERRAAITARLAQQSFAPMAPQIFALTFRPDASVNDGAFGNNPWLQELPDPVTGLCWGNAAHMSEADATALGVTTGTLITITRDTHAVEAPVMVLPGQPPGTLTLPIGYGRTGQERVAAGVGFNAFPLQTAAAPHVATDAQVQTTHRTVTLAWAQEPTTWQSTAPLEGPQTPLPTWLPDNTGDTRVQADTPQWGMAIDLERCTGCHACVIACQAENNIPVVGRDNVIRGRAMHWLRLDRYSATPTFTFQPMLCQQCEHAPCEYVCPVGATQHSPDGLNEMVYNRCVGTRFCANNCPYKVRRFNWFAFQADTSPSERLAHNPDVTVRARGVMEKCTFCVQRIRTGTRRARLAQSPLRADEITTACQQTCPTQAIAFGDLQNPDSAVSRAFAHPRARSALAHLGTRPRVRYLAKEERTP